MAMMNKQALDQAFNRAAAAHKAGNLTEAKSGFERIVKAVPQMAQARFQLARILLEANRAKDAVAHLAAARASAPKQPPVWQLSAVALGVLGDATKIEAFKIELNAAPIPPAAKAELLAKMAINRPPEFGGASKAEMDAVIAALMDRDGPRALELATKLDSTYPGTALIINTLATAYEHSDDSASADVIYRRAIIQDPYAVAVRTNYARFLSENEQFNPASIQLNRATELQPENPKLHALLAIALCETRQGLRAEQAAKRALELDPNETAAKTALANAYSINNKPEKARALFDSLVAANEGMPQSLIYRGNHFQQAGDFAKASADYIAAVQAHPEMTGLYYQIAIGRKFTIDDPIIPIIEQRAAQQPADAPDANLSFALSKIYEDTKQYDRVFAHLRRANDAVAQDWDVAAYTKREHHIHKMADKADLPALSKNSENDFAPIFVTGLPRSGTTLTEQILAAHTTTTGVGEALWSRTALHEVLTDRNAEKRSKADLKSMLQKAGSEYARMAQDDFPSAGRIVDKALSNHEHVGLLKAAMPKARIVILKRDPRDNLLSIYKNRFAANGLKYNTDLRALAYYYSRFLKWLDYWQDQWPDSFYTLDYDKLTADPEGETRKLLGYCGLDWQDGVLDFHKGDNNVRTLSVYQVRQPIYRSSVRGWERYKDDLAPLFDALEEFGVPLPD